MRNKKWFFIGGFLTALFLFLGLPKTIALAAEGECHLKHCLVPAPTILMPVDGDQVTTLRPEIRGLSWKTTVVKVYIDGRELSNVQFRKHEDNYGSFFVVPDYDLTPGEHYIYTIAHSEKPGWYDQSKESIYIDINVKRIVVPAAPATLPVMPQMPEPAALPPDDIESADTTIIPDLPPDNASTEPEENQEPVDIINQNGSAEDFNVINLESEGEVNIIPGQIEGGVSVEQDNDSPRPTLQEAAGLSDLGELLQDEFEAKNSEEREKKNRLIGLVMLAIILVTTIIWLTLERKNKIRQGTGDDDEGFLPPPPVPPESKNQKNNKTINQTSFTAPFVKTSEVKKALADKPESRDEEITVEPIKEEDDIIDEMLAEEPSNEYWASPPPSRYSPYPPAVEVDKMDDKKNDLGL